MCASFCVGHLVWTYGSCFDETGVEEVSVPDGVRELCDGCSTECKSLRRVTFGPSSLLERIGVEAFGAVQEGFSNQPFGVLSHLSAVALRL